MFVKFRSLLAEKQRNDTFSKAFLHILGNKHQPIHFFFPRGEMSNITLISVCSVCIRLEPTAIILV